MLAAPRRWPRPAVGLDGVRVPSLWGRTRTGRPLIVALHHKGGWDWWIVGAREMTAAEVLEFETWEASDD